MPLNIVDLEAELNTFYGVMIGCALGVQCLLGGIFLVLHLESLRLLYGDREEVIAYFNTYA